MNKKRILLGVVIFSIISLLAISTLVYLRNKSFNVIKESGISFKYPKDVEIQKEGFDVYVYYTIRKKFKYELPAKESSISVRIPTRETDEKLNKYTLEELLEAENIQNYIIPLKEININGNKGEMVKYRLDREYVGDFPTHAVFSKIFLDSKYLDTPVRLEYQEKDTDPDSLDEAWKTILKTLKY